MVNKSQIISQIRFQLEQLSARNAHHEFEHLCRHLARVRICSNILPATGPVSAGGDQGRDFETFITYLRSTSIANSTFVGLISQKPVAFSCTIQKEDVMPKIRSDVKTIMDSGSPVESIHYFCVSDIPIARRHGLKSWVKKNYSIELEVHDGQAISELLADREIFWIAERFLSIPSEIYPRADDEDNWYIQSLIIWKDKKETRLNYADFYELKASVRFSTFSDVVRQDVSFWIEILKQFIDGESPLQLRRKAIYEVAVASLRGLGTMDVDDNVLRKYFGMIPTLENPIDLEDTAFLLNYCIGARQRNIVQLTLDELSKWRLNLLSRTEEMLKSVNTPSLKCPLLELRGYLSLSIDPLKPSFPDIDDAIKWWMQLILVAKDAPLFPLERFADRLTNFINFIGEHPQYDDLTQQVDLLLSERHGNFIAAEKCRDRAIKFYENEKIIKALNQLHQAKVKWFAEETLRGSLLSMLLISKWYFGLGLSFAAKYYALAVAFIVINSSKSDVKPLLSEALITAAECDYYQGSWCGFLELTDFGLKAYNVFSKEKEKITMEDEFQRTLFHLTTLHYITKRVDLQLLHFVEGWVQKWGMEDWLKDTLPMVQNTWDKQTISELWTSIEEQIGGRPFSDLGNERKVIWSELGIIWKMSWKNDYETTQAVEQLIAILQILLADLAGIDLCLLKTNVNISVCVDNIAEPKVDPIPSNVGREWKVILPIPLDTYGDSDFEDLQIRLLAIVNTILAEVSLLLTNKFYEVLEDCFKNGISMKSFVVKPYDVLYRQFINKELFESSMRTPKPIPEPNRQFSIKEHKETTWFEGPGPGYSKEMAEDYLKNRYTRSIIPIKNTLNCLLNYPEFISIVKRLREDGWLDWHILSSISSIAIDYRVKQFPEAQNSIDVNKMLYIEMMSEPEKETLPTVPISEFTEEKIRMQHNINMVSTIKMLGLECRQITPDLKAIDHFLGKRYNYWTDDIDHVDPFIIK